MFSGLSAFPITPMSVSGRVDADCLGRLIERCIDAKVSSVGLLGSTGTYMFLSLAERQRACEAAADAVAGRLPLIVGVGAMRTDQAIFLARHAQASGADGLLLAPVSYTPLTEGEVEAHYREVAAATDLPLCIYSNPGTTSFHFSDELIAELATEDRIVSAKLPLTTDPIAQLSSLRSMLPQNFALGYSGDWGLVPSMQAGADGFFSAIAGTLPFEIKGLMDDVAAGNGLKADLKFSPLWDLCRAHGSLRVVYAIAEELALTDAKLPLPLRGLRVADRAMVKQALEAIGV